MPEWLRALEAPEVEEEAPPVEEAPFMEEAPLVEEAPPVEEVAPEAEVVVPPQVQVPESLRALVEAGILDESDLATAMAEMSEEDLEAQRAEAVPEWLRDLMGEEAPVSDLAPAAALEEETIEPPQEEELPDWLREWEEAEEEVVAEPAVAEPAVEAPEAELEEPELEEPELEEPELEERILAPPVTAAPEEVLEVEGVPAEEVEEEEVLEEAPVLEEMVLEPAAAEVPAAEAPEAEVEEPEEEAEPVAAPPSEIEMVAPYDRVEIEEEIPEIRRIDDLAQQLKANPRDYALRLELARLYRQERDWDAALTHYQKLISARKLLPAVLDDLSPLLGEAVEQPRVYQLMGDAYMQQDDLEKALEMYRLAQQALIKQ